MSTVSERRSPEVDQGPSRSDPGTEGRARLRRALRRDVVFAAAAIVVAVLSILPGRDGAGTSISTMQLVASMAAMVVAAVGLNLLIGYARLVSLGQGAFYAIGAYGSAYLSLDAGWPPLLAISGAIGLCMLVGAVTAVASMRLRGPQFAVITLVLAVLVERILNEGAAFGRLAGYPNFADHDTTVLEPMTVFGVDLRPPMIAGEVATVMVPIVLVAALVVIVVRNIIQSPWGASLRAIGESEMLAAHLGVPVFRRKVVAFVLASALGGLGGVMATLAFGHLQPETFDIYLTITIVLAVVFGGSGTVLGPVLGAVAIVWLEQSDLLRRAGEWQQDTISEHWYLSTSGLVGVLFLLTLFLMPRGLVGTAERTLLPRLGRRGHGADAGPRPAPTAATTGSPDVASAAPDEGGVLLRLDGLVKQFGGLRAVDGMDLSVSAGAIHAIIGPNGAGKSTLANLVTGVYEPSAGSVRLRGTDLTGLPPHRVVRAGIGRTFQTPQLFHDETVRDNVLAGFPDIGRLPLWAAALKPPSRYRRDAHLQQEADRLLHLVGLADVADLRASELPYGKQRALEIARALAGGPTVIVLDEPAAGLLATETHSLGDLLLGLRDRGYALVVVEHHMDLVARIADTVTCMDQGGLLARGSAQEVLSDERVISAYLGRPDTGTEDAMNRERRDEEGGRP